MREGPIVCDTGPLIALSLVDSLSLLPQLYSRVAAPRIVLEEVSAGGGARPGTEEILAARWLEVLEEVAVDPLLGMELGRGEAAVIASAYELQAPVVLLDERKARRVATHAYELRVKGSAGLLVSAKRAGLIPAVGPLLESLRARGYYLSDRVVVRATLEAGEGSGE